MQPRRSLGATGESQRPQASPLLRQDWASACGYQPGSLSQLVAPSPVVYALWFGGIHLFNKTSQVDVAGTL